MVVVKHREDERQLSFLTCREKKKRKKKLDPESITQAVLFNIEIETTKEMTHCMEGKTLSIHVPATESMKIKQKVKMQNSVSQQLQFFSI